VQQLGQAPTYPSEALSLVSVGIPTSGVHFSSSLLTPFQREGGDMFNPTEDPISSLIHQYVGLSVKPGHLWPRWLMPLSFIRPFLVLRKAGADPRRGQGVQVNPLTS
jgi:hypothetical protein